MFAGVFGIGFQNHLTFSANEGRKGQLVMETDNKSTGKQIDRILIEKLLKKKLDDNDKKLIKKHSA